MADDDQKLRVRLVGRDGRRRYEATSKEYLVAASLEPGVSVSRLALEHGVNANLLRKWIKKHIATRSLPPSSTYRRLIGEWRYFLSRSTIPKNRQGRLDLKWHGYSSAKGPSLQVAANSAKLGAHRDYSSVAEARCQATCRSD